MEAFKAEEGIQFKRGQSKPEGLRVTGKLGFADHPMIEHFRFLKNPTNAVAKMTLPSPSVLHYRGGCRFMSESAYPTMEEFFHDLGQVYKKAVNAFAQAGCKYLRLDL